MKYILYRSLGSIDKDVKKHEIVGVEFGDSIDDVADDLIRDAADDLAALLLMHLSRSRSSGASSVISMK